MTGGYKVAREAREALQVPRFAGEKSYSKKGMYRKLIDLIGNTPLLHISHKKQDKVKVYAKAEYFNPGGSVKDRPVKAILEAALREDLLKDKILIDASSGNTGIAYAMLGAEMGLSVELAIPENASPERKKILELYGAKLHYTSRFEGTDGAQSFVKERVAKEPDKYYYPDQYNNENNWKAHYASTGPEIWEGSKGKVSHFCTGIGTSGSFVGTTRFLKAKGVECIQVLPDNPIHGLEGWKHLETALVPGIYDPKLASRTIEVSTEYAFAYALAAARYLGLLISPSSAANLWAALHLAQELEEGYIVTIFPDNAMKYMGEEFWSMGNKSSPIPNPF